MAGYKSRFKAQIICMIEKGYNNKQIVNRLGCNAKYPVVIRGQLKKMDPKEKRLLVAQAKREVEGVKQPENRSPGEIPETGFNTPTKMAKGRFYRSGY